MQVQDKFIINTQTVQPFTKVQRNFNMKEANSDNCIGGSCSINTSSKPAQQSLEQTIEPVISMETIAPVVNTNVPVNTETNNARPQDYTYNSKEDWRAPTFNQWTRIFDDTCSEQNRLRIGSKPMKYFVNEYNSPEVDPFMNFTVIGNQKQYDVRNDYERAVPTRLNPLYPVSVLPYNTTPFVGSANVDRQYVDTSSNLRWGSDIKNMKSQNGTTEVDFNRWSPGVSAYTVQNAGQFAGMKVQQAGPDGYYDYSEQNNVLLYNSAIPYFGISSRNLLHNVVDLSGC